MTLPKCCSGLTFREPWAGTTWKTGLGVPTRMLLYLKWLRIAQCICVGQWVLRTLSGLLCQLEKSLLGLFQHDMFVS